MSELISVGILVGLALWGYGSWRAGAARVRKAGPPKRRAKHRDIAAMLLMPMAAIHLAMAQAPEAPTALATPVAASSATVVPMLVRYNGVAIQSDGRPKTGATPVTFFVYKDEQGGEALWTETQSVLVDATGKYEVYLGSTRSSGLPADLFGSGEARWLEVQVTGEPTRPRTLLVSVPYALHAADAATLGGLPASAFARAGASGAASISSPDAIAAASSSGVTTPGGTIGRVPVFTGVSTIGNSILYASPTALGIGLAPSIYGVLDVGGQSIFRGPLDVSRTGNASASTGTNSNPLLFNFQFYNSSANFVYNPYFSFQAEATGNNTASPAGTMNFLYYNGIGGKPAETGLYFNTDGTIHFAPNQVFPFTSSSSTALAGTSGTGIGVQGNSTAGTGVQGVSTNSYGVEGTSIYGPGMLGYTGGNNGNTAGVIGEAGQTSGFPGIAGIWGDSYSHVGVYGTSVQAPGVFGLSSVGLGVQGQSTSNSGVQGTSTSANGVFGQAGGTSGFTGIAGVWGDTSTHVGVYGTSAQAAGVLGLSTNGPGIQGSSTNSYAGQFSSSSSAAVYSVNSASLGGSGVYGVSQGTDGIGLYGTGTGSNGTGVLGSGIGNGVLGSTTGGVLNTAGVLGVAGARTGGSGIAGVWGDAQEHVGVIGSSKDYPGVFGTSTNSIGVQASSTTSAAVYAVAGASNLSTGDPIGVWGDVTGCCSQLAAIAILGTATNGTAGQFTNNSILPTVFIHNYGDGDTTGDVAPFRVFQASTSDGTCGFGDNGNLTCTGQMKSLATTGNGARTVETYSMQSPENWMEDFGSATLQNGHATVSIDAAFAETVSGTADYHVFLTPRGDSKGLYVTNTTAASFEVHESGGGTSTLSFDYRIVAKRRGFETQRMVDVTEAMRAVNARNDLQAERFKSTAKNDRAAK